MDGVVSHALAFLVGAGAGAVSAYLADKYTDKRRARDQLQSAARLWRDIEQRFPGVIAEMRTDFSSEEGKNVRVMFVTPKGTVMGFLSEPAFIWHPEDHPDLIPAIRHLERHGFVADVTKGDTLRFRVHEELIDRLTWG
jgi:hypothetical protein